MELGFGLVPLIGMASCCLVHQRHWFYRHFSLAFLGQTRSRVKDIYGQKKFKILSV